MLFIDTAGLEKAQSTLNQMLAQGRDITPILRDLGDEEVLRIVERFERSQAPDGSSWAALKTRNGKPLLDTGALRKSIQKQILGGVSLEIGTNLSYAAFHQFGTKYIPARRFLGTSEALIRQAEELIREHFIEL